MTRADALIASPRREHRLIRLAVTAAAYVAAIRRGERSPTGAVAREQHRPTAHVRDDLGAARRACLLTGPAGPGRAGGTLTDRGTELLEAEDGVMER